MFKYLLFVALLAFASAKPLVVEYPVGYTAPYASAAYTAPVAYSAYSSYAAPVAYSAYSAYSPYAYYVR